MVLGQAAEVGTEALTLIDKYGIVPGLFAIMVLGMVVLLGWIIVKHLPRMQDKFVESLSQQRIDFRDELQIGRAQSARLAEEGHEAVRMISKSVDAALLRLPDNK